MHLPRPVLVHAYRQVKEANDSLVRAFNTRQATPQRVQELVGQGALTSSLPIADWRETFQEQNLPLLAALLSGAEDMTRDQRADRIRLCLTYGSIDQARLLVGQGWFEGLQNRAKDFFRDAIVSDCIEKVDVLIEQGFDVLFGDGALNESSCALSFVASPQMFHHLVSKGCQWTTSQMVGTAILNQEAPNPALLKAFLDAGTNTEEKIGVMAWNALFRKKMLSPEQHRATVECGSMLIAANARRNPGSVYSLASLVAALEAGMPPVEAVPTLVELWKAPIFPKDQLPGPTAGANSTNDRIRQVLPLLLNIEKLGVDIDMFALHGRCSGTSTALLFHLAGLETGHSSFNLSASDVSNMQAAQLARQTASSPPAKHSRRM